MASNQQIADKMRMKKECIERISLSLGRQVTAEEASDLLASIRAGMVKLRQQDEKKWRSMSRQERADAASELYRQAVKADAEKQKQRAYLTVIAQDRINRRSEFHRARGYRGLSITQAVLEDVNRKVLATQNEYVTAFAKDLEGEIPGFMGLFADKNFERAVVREIYGESTGSALAKKAADLFSTVSETERQRFNRAGGNMGKLDHYVPQNHDVVRMSHSAEILRKEGRIRWTYNKVKNSYRDKVDKHDENQAAWVAYIAPKLDRSKYIDVNGDLMGDADFYQMLARVYDTIVTGGDQDFDVSTVAGNSARSSGASRANRGDQHRALHFKDAQSFSEYQKKFGRGTVIDSMLGSIRRTAKDIALLEELGPEPNNMVRGMVRVGEAEIEQGKLVMGKFKGGLSVALVDASWATLNGDASRVMPERESFADFMQGARNMEVVGKLQSTLISSFSDAPTYFISARLNKVPVLTAVANLLHGLGKDNRELMARAGVMADTLSQGLSRWAENNVGQGWTSMLANATMKASLLDAWTQAVRRASMQNNMGVLANIVKTKWDALPPYTKRALERAGVDKTIWNIWGLAKPYKQNGASFLTTQDIRDIQPTNRFNLEAWSQRDIDRAATTLITFLTDESCIASLNPDLFTRASTNLGWKKGSIPGEAMRSFMLFKGFAVGFMRRHLERMSDLAQTNGKADAVKYAATIFVSTSLAGAVSVQIKELLAGRDPQDMSLDNQDFWLQAMATGGGAGFLTDFIVSGFNGENAYGSPNVLRALGPVFGTAIDTFDVAKAYVNQGLYDKESSANAKALRLIRGHMPFANLWYAKGVVDRAVYNDLMEMTSPGYQARVQKRSIQQKGSGYWWGMNRLKPRRAPRMADQPNR